MSSWVAFDSRALTRFLKVSRLSRSHTERTLPREMIIPCLNSSSAARSSPLGGKFYTYPEHCPPYRLREPVLEQRLLAEHLIPKRQLLVIQCSADRGPVQLTGST